MTPTAEGSLSESDNELSVAMMLDCRGKVTTTTTPPHFILNSQQQTSHLERGTDTGFCKMVVTNGIQLVTHL